MQPLLTVETNALGYCKCSLLSSDTTNEALVAVPSTLDDTLADIYHLPSGKRVHRSIGKGAFDSKTGTVMCLHLYRNNHNISLIVAYEDGRICVFSRSSQSGQWSEAVMEENGGWSKVNEMRAHKEPSEDLLKRGCKLNAD